MSSDIMMMMFGRGPAKASEAERKEMAVRSSQCARWFRYFIVV